MLNRPRVVGRSVILRLFAFSFYDSLSVVAGRFVLLVALLLIGGCCGTNSEAVRPAPAGGGVGFSGFEVREMLELADFDPLGLVFAKICRA